MSRPEAKRPRLWVPGVLFVDDEGEIVAGAHAGWHDGSRRDGSRAFGGGRRAHPRSLTEMRHRVWLVERAHVTPELVAEHALILPDTLVDPDTQPHARRWLAAQPLLCVSGGKKQRLIDAGMRVYTVAYGVAGEDRLEVAAEGGERAAWSLSARLGDLWPPELRPEADPIERLRQTQRLEVRSFVDRLLAQLSRGALREASVLHALSAHTIVEPGYGYRGADDGVAATVEDIERDVRGLEALFAQILARAEGQRAAAREIAKAVAGAPADARALDELPVYGSARRVELEQVVVSLPDDAELVRAGAREAALELPAEARWFVERVDSWEPELPPEIARELAGAPNDAPVPSPWVALVLMGVLALIVAVGYVLG